MRRELEALWTSVVSGFNASYADPKKTKVDNPEGHFSRHDLDGLIETLQKMFHEGGAAENRALRWIGEHYDELKQMDNYWTRIVVRMYDQRLDY